MLADSTDRSTSWALGWRDVTETIRPEPIWSMRFDSPPIRCLLALATALVPIAGCASSAPSNGTLSSAPSAAPEAPPETPSAASVSSLADGAFTVDQATKGQEAFGDTCGECHDRVEFRGVDFFFEWEGSNVGRFVRLVSETMPEDNPGSLPREQVVAIAAYVLQLNGYPAGDAPLPEDEDLLSQLVFEKPSEAGY